jgi:predicted HAD superfamily Cof-like phosphohydrolase
MSLTNFQKVDQFMTAFEQTTLQTPQLEKYTDDKLFKFRMSLIKEEFKEIKDAISNNDFIEFVDGISDLLVVTYGTGLAFGANLDNLITEYLYKYKNIVRGEKTNYDMIREYMTINNDLICDTPQPKLLNSANKGSTKLIDQLIEPIEFEIKTIETDDNASENACDYINDHKNIFFFRLSNIIRRTYQMGITFGIDVNDAFEIVHQSNMSKLCVSEEEAKQTVEWYLKNESRYPTPTYKSASDGNHWIVYEQSTGKVLKSINYTPANLKKFGQ